LNSEKLDTAFLAELITDLLVYWGDCECYYTDNNFSYYDSKPIELDFDTAENLVLNFSNNFYPDISELINFIDNLHMRWINSSNIKNYYENFYEFLKDISAFGNYYEGFCNYAYEYDYRVNLYEDYYGQEDKYFSLKKNIMRGDISYQGEEINFDKFNFIEINPNKKDSSSNNITEELTSLESFLEEQSIKNNHLRLANIFTKLMDSDDE